MATLKPLFLESKATLERIDKKDAPVYGSTIGNLSALYFDMNRLDEVEPLLLKTKELMKQNFGEGHPDYAACMINIGALYSEQKNYYKAEQLYGEYNALTERTLGKNTANYALGIRSLGECYQNTGRLEESIALTKEAEEILDVEDVRFIKNSNYKNNHPKNNKIEEFYKTFKTT